MKRNLYLGLAVLAALGLSACQKDILFEDTAAPVAVTLTAERAGAETRAAAVEGVDAVSYAWTDTDLKNFKLFQVTTKKVNQGGTTVEKEVLTEIKNPTLTLSSDNKVLSVTVSVNPGVTLRAVVASQWVATEPDCPRPNLPASQNVLTDNLDPAADILVSEDVSLSGRASAKLYFHRPVTVNKMVLKGLNAAERVNKVVISSDKDLLGSYDYYSQSIRGNGKELTLNYADGTVHSSELFPVYFVTAPNSGHTLTITVETVKDSKVFRYVKTLTRPVNFTQGLFSTFTVMIRGYGEEVGILDWSGTWVIYATDGGHTFAAKKSSGKSYLPASEVMLKNDVMTVSGSKDSYKMTFTLITEGDNAGRYTIQDVSGKYLSSAASLTQNSMNFLTTVSENSYWIIDPNADGTFNINADFLEDYYRKSLRADWHDGLPRMSCYAMDSPLPKCSLFPFDQVVEGTVK